MPDFTKIPKRLDAKEKRYLGAKQKVKKAQRFNDLEVLAGLEGKKLLKPGQRVRRFIAQRPGGKRLQHNIPTLD